MIWFNERIDLVCRRCSKINFSVSENSITTIWISTSVIMIRSANKWYMIEWTHRFQVSRRWNKTNFSVSENSITDTSEFPRIRDYDPISRETIFPCNMSSCEASSFIADELLETMIGRPMDFHSSILIDAARFTVSRGGSSWSASGAALNLAFPARQRCNVVIRPNASGRYSVANM